MSTLHWRVFLDAFTLTQISSPVCIMTSTTNSSQLVICPGCHNTHQCQCGKGPSISLSTRHVTSSSGTITVISWRWAGFTWVAYTRTATLIMCSHCFQTTPMPTDPWQWWWQQTLPWRLCISSPRHQCPQCKWCHSTTHHTTSSRNHQSRCCSWGDCWDHSQWWWWWWASPSSGWWGEHHLQHDTGIERDDECCSIIVTLIPSSSRDGIAITNVSMTVAGSRHLAKPGAKPAGEQLPIQANWPGPPKGQSWAQQTRPQQSLVWCGGVQEAEEQGGGAGQRLVLMEHQA